MHRPTPPRRSRLGLRLGLAAALLPLLGGIAVADVVLHPGTVAGPVGLSGWSFYGGSVYIDSNASGFSSSASISNGAYSLTVEGGQTYGRMYAYQYANNGYFSLFSNVSRTVTVAQTLPVDLTRAGGTIVGRVHLVNNGLDGAAPVVAQVTLASFNASGYNASGDEQYSANANGYDANDVAIPMAAATGVSVGGYVQVSITDAANRTCSIRRSFPQQTVNVAEGASVVVDEEIDVSTVTCAPPLSGVIAVNNVPGGVELNFAYAYAGGNVSTYLDGNGQTYSFPGLEPGQYYVSAYTNFPAPFNSTLSLPTGSQPYVTVSADAPVTRDFIFDGAVATGRLTIAGAGAGLANSGQIYFYGVGDNQGGSAYGSATFNQGNGSGVYQTVTTAGQWQSAQTYVGFWDDASQTSSYLYLSTNGSPETFAAGSTTDRGEQTIATSAGRIVLDVIEPPGSPTIGISNPQINASRYDGNGWVQIGAYVSVSGAATPGVRLIGPPGTYQFEAYGTVNGSQTRFASSTIELGQSVNTPTGSHVVVTPRDAAGNPLPLRIEFTNVVSSGDTSASVTSVGPAVPSDYEQVAIINGQSYLDVASTSALGGPVEVAIHYDPAALNLTAAQESRLTLLHYECPTANDCAWQVINETYSPGDRYFGHAAPPNGNPDTSSHTIYGVTSASLAGGLFALAVPRVTLTPPTSACIGSTTEPVQRNTAPGACTVTVDNTNQLAGGCSGGGGGLMSCAFDGAATRTYGLGAHTVAIVGTANDTSTSSCSSHITVVDREEPRVTCPAAARVECTGRTTAAAVGATCTDNCTTACAATCGGGSYALGTTPVACNGRDAAGNEGSCTTAVTVVDTTAPSLALTVSPPMLWPPNHRLRPITVTTSTNDACDSATAVRCTAASNESDNGLGDGDTAGDVSWQNGELFLRAERSGTGTGRTYTITCTATDASGNRTVRTATVRVPQSQ
ncbi:MAG: hypothetical protein JWM10_2016 [Myxococcaceae bacterium]|nr:hypothetical protein [Myxococcaceae bacterium]